jgi:hypothetical protein
MKREGGRGLGEREEERVRRQGSLEAFVGSLDRQSWEQGVNFLVGDASLYPPCFFLSLPFLAHLCLRSAYLGAVRSPLLILLAVISFVVANGTQFIQQVREKEGNGSVKVERKG